MDILDPFMTVARQNPDFSDADERSEAKALIDRQDAIERSLRGEEPPDYLFDLLESQEIDPVQYIHAVADNIHYCFDNGIRFTSNESGLFIPDTLV